MIVKSGVRVRADGSWTAAVAVAVFLTGCGSRIEGPRGSDDTDSGPATDTAVKDTAAPHDGTPGSPLAACTASAACGGSLIGTWLFQAACFPGGKSSYTEKQCP